MCAYTLVTTSPLITWSTMTSTPSDPPESVETETVPSAIAWISAPRPGLKSCPPWSLEHPAQSRYPKRSPTWTPTANGHWIEPAGLLMNEASGRMPAARAYSSMVCVS
jgi:hypothetical protein